MKSRLHLQNIGAVRPESEAQPRAVPTLKQSARAKVNLLKKELVKEIARKMINPYYFSKRYQRQYSIDLEQYHPNQINSKITVKSNYNLPVEILYLNKILKEMAWKIYGRLINQYKFKYQVVFSVIFDKETQDELEQYVSLEVNQSLTWSDIEKLIQKQRQMH